MFVNLAARLDDGAAMNLTIAFSRSWGIATDDPKTRKICDEIVGGDNQLLFSTSDLIRNWIKKEKIKDEIVKTVLSAIEKKAICRVDLN